MKFPLSLDGRGEGEGEMIIVIPLTLTLSRGGARGSFGEDREDV